MPWQLPDHPSIQTGLLAPVAKEADYSVDQLPTHSLWSKFVAQRLAMPRAQALVLIRRIAEDYYFLMPG